MFKEKTIAWHLNLRSGHVPLDPYCMGKTVSVSSAQPLALNFLIQAALSRIAPMSFPIIDWGNGDGDQLHSHSKCLNYRFQFKLTKK